MTAALEGGERSAARPGRTLPPGKTRYPFYRRLGGPQGRSGRAENLVPTGIRSRTVQPVVNRYTDWATRPTHTHTHTHIYSYIYSLPKSACNNQRISVTGQRVSSEFNQSGLSGISSHVIEPIRSLPCLQQPFTCPCPEPDKSNSVFSILFLWFTF